MSTTLIQAGTAMQSESKALNAVPAVSYKHLTAKANFRVKAQPLSGSMVPWLFKPRLLPIDTGMLVDYLISQIRLITGAVNTLHFTLVNVQSPLSMSSVGFYAGPPPESALPGAHGSLCFTFALAPDVNWNSVIAYKKVFKSIYVNTFNTDTSARPQFLNIVISTQQAYEWGLTNLTWYRLQYLYYAVGMMTKNRIMKQRELKGNPDMAFRAPKDPWLLYNSIEYRSLAFLPNQIQYQNWCYNVEVLMKAPNLLSSKHVSAQFLLFLVTRNLLAAVDLPLYIQVHVDALMRQVVNVFVRMASRGMGENKNPNNLTRFECIIPMMIYASRYGTEGAQSMDDRSVQAWTKHVLESLSVRPDMVNEQMAPEEETALDLAAGRMGRIETLSNTLAEIENAGLQGSPE